MREIIDIDEDILYLAGAIHDGCLVKRRKIKKYDIQFYQKNKEWLENSIVARIKRLIGKEIRIKGPRKGVYYLKFGCKSLYLSLDSILRNPKEILLMNTSLQRNFIKGFFDAEGYVPRSWKRRKYFQIGFSQSGKRIPETLKIIKKLLEKEGIKCGKISKKRPKNFGKLPHYSFLICGRDDLKKFLEKIGVEHPEKLKNLKRLLSDR